MSSLPLFLEDVYDALKAAVQAAGGPKEVAHALWPTTPIERAKRDLMDCLNRGNGRKLDIEEALAILKMAKDAGFHQSKHWIDTELGYETTKPVDRVVQQVEIANRLDRLFSEIADLRRAAERIADVPVPTSILKRA